MSLLYNGQLLVHQVADDENEGQMYSLEGVLIEFNAVSPASMIIKWCTPDGVIRTSNYAFVAKGTVVTYSASADGFETVSSTITATESVTIDITLGSNVASYIFRNIDSDYKVTKATGALESGSAFTSIGNRELNAAFINQQVTGKVDFPNVTTINYYGMEKAFSGTSISSIDFSSLTNVYYYGMRDCFFNCSSLTGAVSFPELLSVDTNAMTSAFAYTKVSSLSFPKLTYIGNAGMTYLASYQPTSDITTLTSISFPKLETIVSNGLNYAFTRCTKLSSVSFPELTSVGSGALSHTFEGCSGITNIHFKSSLSGNSECTKTNMFNDASASVTISFDL